jgi:uncharacterized membrane protein YesL
MDFDALDNINDFVLNETLINDSTEVIANIAYAAEPATGGWFGLMIYFAMYIFTVYILYRNDGDFKMSFVKSSVYSSFMVLTVGILLFTIGITTNFRHLMWIAIVFLISLIGVWMQKQA